ncbi:MAG TPA: glycine cleavage system protein GcvH [Rhodocyclaceae bacterium]|jgi:glycine cleavage system H protein|nr:glycine cleavage system protein GcvH [Rhodocyclaceae bacterium]
MKLPAELKYAATHEWSRKENDGTLTVGITDHAQYTLGDIVFVQLPEVGRAVKAGEEIAMIESVKAASGIHAPVSGSIVATNQAVVDAPEGVNDDAYAAWLFRIQPANAADFDSLLDAAGYEAVAE